MPTSPPRGVAEPSTPAGVLRVTCVDPRSDEELLRDHLAGKPAAFDALVARYVEDLYSFFERFVGNGAAAEDLVQETLLQVHLAAGAFDPTRTFKPWLYTIAANKGRDHLRARGRRPAQSLDVATGHDETMTVGTLLEAESPDLGAQVDGDARRQLVHVVMNELPEAQKLMLVLGYFQRLPYSEIADILGVPVGTVKSRLHAAVNKFGELWRARTTPAGSEG